MLRQIIIFLLLLTVFSGTFLQAQEVEKKNNTNMILKSPVFVEGGMIPAKYTCDGENVSPPLSWMDLPVESKSLALVCEDPDAPRRTWIHWVIYNIPADTTCLREAIPRKERLKNGTKQGMNDFRKIGYSGPCPPASSHRYVFTLYALSKKLNLVAGETKEDLLKDIKNFILAESQLTGTYQRP
jgi:Raf kinase inhibitor-like YbhB/YbcL family protein